MTEPREDRTPVLVGAAQLVERDADPREALSPLRMLERVARDAAADAGVGAAALAELDCIGVVDVMAWHPRNAPRLLGQTLGAHARREYVPAVGGESPLVLLNHVAREIATGETRMALLAGCNAVRTLRRARKEGVELDWPQGGEGEPTPLGKVAAGSSEAEKQHGLYLPSDVYPFFENALRARRGLDLRTHRRRMGALFAPFTEVAAKNPYAWFPVARSAEELVTVTRENRMVAFPYTKYLNAVMETNQAAGVLVTSSAVARALGIPEERWVHWWGGARGQEEAWFPSERPDPASCPSMRSTHRTALRRAGVGLDEIDFFDLYSCFPVAVEMACEMLGLDEGDPRGLTVTGGLPYAGGPGNNYCLHAVAAMLERLRARPGAKALVTGNGWYLTKHSASVLASASSEGFSAESLEAVSAPSSEGEDAKPVPVLARARGAARIVTYTVVFDREGAPARGVVLGALEGEPGRFVAETPADRSLLEGLVSREAVGLRGRVSQHDGKNVFSPE